MKLTQKQVAALWVVEGGDPAKADEWSAIVMAESGGDTKVGNYCCHGLAALNVEVGVASMACALNAVCSTRKAISLSGNGKDWTPWEGFTNGNYSKFLGGSKGTLTKADSRKLQRAGADPSKFAGAPFHLPLPGPLDPGNIWEEAESVIGGGGEAVGSIGEVSKFLKGLGELILTPDGWKRLGLILGGGIFILMGVNSVLKSGYNVDAARTVKRAADTAAVAATVK